MSSERPLPLLERPGSLVWLPLVLLLGLSGASASPDTAGSLGKVVAGVDDPGVVFSLLREGVAAYSARVAAATGLPTDEWGNPRGPGYKSARRPDTVPTELATFLVDYYRDKPGYIVAATASQAASIAAQMAANEAANAAARAAAERDRAGGGNPGGGGGGSGGGDGPPATNNPRPGDPGGNPTGPGRGTEPVPNLPGHPTAKAEDLLHRYGVFFSEDGKPFTDREIGLIDRVLAGVPKTFYWFVNHRSHQHLTFVREVGEAGKVGATVADKGRVILYDGAWTPQAEDFQGAPEEYRQDAQFLSIATRLIVKVGLHHDPKTGLDGDYSAHPMVVKWAELFGWTRQGEGWSGQGAGIYQNMTHPGDELATVTGLYFSDPQHLKDLNMRAYEFLSEQGFVQQPALPRNR